MIFALVGDTKIEREVHAKAIIDEIRSAYPDKRIFFGGFRNDVIAGVDANDSKCVNLCGYILDAIYSLRLMESDDVLLITDWLEDDYWMMEHDRMMQENFEVVDFVYRSFVGSLAPRVDYYLKVGQTSFEHPSLVDVQGHPEVVVSLLSW